MDTPLPGIPPEDQTEDAEYTAERVKNGEYFREMRHIYASMYLDPMPARYYYLFFTGICVLIFVFILYSFSSLFPLEQDIPFLYYSNNVLEEKPVIRPLLRSRKEDNNLAIKRYLAGEYVRRRESYDIDTLELNVRFVKAQSSQGVFDAWQGQLDPGNPESPIAQFQRHSSRVITVQDTSFNQDGSVDVAYDATVEDKAAGSQEAPRVTHMMATLAFQYTDVTIDQSTGRKTPLHFMVTQYRTRRLQE